MAKKTKFQLGDHVTYSNKRLKYSYIGEIIAKSGRWCVVEIYYSSGSVQYRGAMDVPHDSDFLPEKFMSVDYVWGTSRRSISSNCVWDSSQFLHHVIRPYEEGQNGDTDDDI